MRHLKTELIYAAGALVSGVILRYIEWPDSLFASLAVLLAAEVISSMLRMCDRLLDPPPAIFLIFCHHRNNFSRFSHMP
jgi:hypothetical protein